MKTPCCFCIRGADILEPLSQEISQNRELMDYNNKKIITRIEKMEATILAELRKPKEHMTAQEWVSDAATVGTMMISSQATGGVVPGVMAILQSFFSKKA